MLILRWLKFKPTFNLSKNNCRNLSAKCKLEYFCPFFNIYIPNNSVKNHKVCYCNFEPSNVTPFIKFVDELIIRQFRNHVNNADFCYAYIVFALVMVLILLAVLGNSVQSIKLFF